MTIPEIRQLRKNGNLDEALKECQALIELYPEDRNARLELAWTIKDFASKAAAQADTRALIDYMLQVRDMNLENIGEQGFMNRFAWEIKTLFDALQSDPARLVDAADSLWSVIPQLGFAPGYQYYNMLPDVFLKVKGPGDAPWRPYADLLDWWGFDNFNPDDYKRRKLQNGKFLLPLVDRAYNGYHKTLMADIKEGNINNERIESFINNLRVLNELHPEYPYTSYRLGCLLHAVGRDQDAFEVVAPFVSKKQSEFWIWDLLGDLTDDEELKLACWCRGLTCRTEPGFLARLRLKTAMQMHKLGYNDNARTEIRALRDLYAHKGWHFPREVIDMVRQDWYQNANPLRSNDEFYREHMAPTEKFLISATPEVPIFILHINKEKGTCTFVNKDKKMGYFYVKPENDIEENRVYLVKFENSADLANAKIISCRPTENDIIDYDGVFYMQFNGTLKKRDDNPFGFVDEIFIDGRLLPEGAVNGDEICGIAIPVYNRKKEAWGWKALCTN